MIRGSYLGQKELQGLQVFPIKPIVREKIEDGYVKKFIDVHLSEYKYIDETSGYVIEGVHEQIPVLQRYKMTVYLVREVLTFDKLFIDGDKILFMNSETKFVRRINPQRIVTMSLDVAESVNLTNI